MNNTEISIIIPVYQSSLSLKGLFDDIQNLLQNNFKNYELILVNDNSSDNSWDIIKSLCEKNSWIKGINLRKNVGQHNATFVGLKHAIGDIIVTLIIQAQMWGLSATDCLTEVYKEISQRKGMMVNGKFVKEME